MMYRVFLQDEKDAPSPSDNPSNTFRIRSGEKLAWTHTDGNYTPTLESQLSSTGCGSYVGPSSEPLDGHWLINYDGLPLAICHSQNEIPERAYEIARTQAQRLAEYLSREKGKPYIFIDLTSGGDSELAKKLSKIIHEVRVPDASPRAADIGD